MPATRLCEPSVSKIAGHASRICSNVTGPVNGSLAFTSAAACCVAVAEAVTCEGLSGAGVVDAFGFTGAALTTSGN